MQSTSEPEATGGKYRVLSRRTELERVNESSRATPAIQAPLTAQQLAAIVPLHPVTLLRWAREGKIPHRRLSARKILFLPSEISAWLASGPILYPLDAGRAA